jgi:drug/metabolite transporter (DMT)-like permease
MLVSKAFISVFVKLFLGAAQYILLKDLFHYEVGGKEFNRTYFVTFATFAAMVLTSLPLGYGEVLKCFSPEAPTETSNVYSLRGALLTSIPGFLDFLALQISYEASLTLAASVVVLLKATRVIFTASLTSFILKKSQKPYQWVGIVITILGVVPIAGESLLRAKSGGKQKSSEAVMIALALILAAELFRAIRFVYEERLLKKERLSPSFMVLMESCFGLGFATASWFFADFVGFESISETFSMLRQSGPLQGILITAVLAAGICNIAGAFITKYLSSVHNALVSELRVVFVWLPNVIRYFIDKEDAALENRSPKGEPLDWFSTLKVAGFGILILGAYVYNGNVRLSCSRLYPVEPTEDKPLAVI